MFVPLLELLARLGNLRLFVTGIGEKDWSFKTEFTLLEGQLRSSNADLVFEGLDTFAKVSLVSDLNRTPFSQALTFLVQNGEKILE